MEYLEDMLTEESLANWEERMSDPVVGRDLTEEEMEELRREGII